jgi:RsiW-degrading membrane proteinase PrsW (M82 family)
MAKVTVEVELDSRWVKLVHSPVYWIVAALTGVSITFAPLFLYYYGKGKGFPGTEWVVVPLCFATIYFVGMFYMMLGGAVVAALRKK